MKPELHAETVQIAGTAVTFETGRIARQASGAVCVRSGDNVLLATVVVGPERPGLDFFPLTVEYREKLAAAGRIPGAYGRREGRIADREVLTSRLIDRTIRSLFPKGYHRDVQVQVTVLSADPDADHDSLGILAACAALHLSPAPAAGPAAGLRIVDHGAGFTAFPSRRRRADAVLDFTVSAGPSGLVMVEGEASEASEARCIEALEQAQAWIAKTRKVLEALREKGGREKDPLPEPRAVPALPEAVENRLGDALSIAGKAQRHAALDAERAAYLAALDEDERPAAERAFDAAAARLVRERILADGRRLDGRGLGDVRPIWGEVGLLPRAHGSALFTRGETQAIVTCTLGTSDDRQRVETLAGETEEHFLLHYNFPPYSVGEVRPLRGPGRREIGHGYLARRGLGALMPSFDDFPYTVRVESEISESNGSSSMATVCGGCLAMMDAGVPLRRPVAGIAMGLVTDGERTAVLSDILGDEDHLGDMDFKVVGTAEGVTALQLDNKVGGLTQETLAQALEQARQARLHVLDEMARILGEPRPGISSRAPQVVRTAILPDHVAVLIGPRGQTIKSITQATGARVNVDDDGIVRVYGPDAAAVRKAIRMVGRTCGVVRRGGYYRGSVTTVRDFGVFVRLNEVVEGMVPRDEMHERTAGANRQDLGVEPGDTIVVRVLGVDDRGRLRLSRRAAFDVDEALIEW